MLYCNLVSLEDTKTDFKTREVVNECLRFIDIEDEVSHDLIKYNDDLDFEMKIAQSELIEPYHVWTRSNLWSWDDKEFWKVPYESSSLRTKVSEGHTPVAAYSELLANSVSVLVEDCSFTFESVDVYSDEGLDFAFGFEEELKEAPDYRDIDDSLPFQDCEAIDLLECYPTYSLFGKNLATVDNGLTLNRMTKFSGGVDEVKDFTELAYSVIGLPQSSPIFVDSLRSTDCDISSPKFSADEFIIEQQSESGYVTNDGDQMESDDIESKNMKSLVYPVFYFEFKRLLKAIKRLNTSDHSFASSEMILEKYSNSVNLAAIINQIKREECVGIVQKLESSGCGLANISAENCAEFFNIGNIADTTMALKNFSRSTLVTAYDSDILSNEERAQDHFKR